MKKNLFMLAAFVMLLAIHSCKKETENPTPSTPTPNTPITPNGMIKIGETYVLGAQAKAYIYAKEALFTGYNTLFVALYDSINGTQLTDGHFNLSARMDMGMMNHSCPIEVNEEIDASTKLYQSNLVFIMPGTTGWELTIDYHNHKIDKEGTGILPIQVVDANPKRVSSMILAGDDSAKVFVSFVLPTKGKVGLNDAEFTIHKKMSNDSFPPVTNYTVEMIPTMPSMGHGSPNNVHPTHTGLGHYKGKVNFTMTGLWQIQLKLFKDGVLLTDKILFDITL